MNRGVLFDLDGTLVRAFPEGDTTRGPRTRDEVEVLPGTAEAAESIQNAGYLCFVVSNQPDVARGLIERRPYAFVIAEVAQAIKLPMARFFICQHDGDWCACRKPKPGMIFHAALVYELDLSRCWLIGDRETDREAAIRAGIPSSQAIKLDTNQGIGDATAWILNHSK